MKDYPSKQLFDIHVKGKNISIQQKMTKIRSFENKVLSYLLVNFFVVMFFNSYLFFHHVSCCNPNLGRVTKARACKSASQK